MRTVPGTPCSLSAIGFFGLVGPRAGRSQARLFSHGTGWVDYEHLQADIYDRVLAVLPEFNLRLFQEPTGDDLRALVALENRDES